jgi:predicted Zn-dependent protease
MKKLNLPLLILSFIASVLIIISCAINPVTGKKQLMLMSEEQEIQLGISYNPQVLATFGEYADNNLQNFVQAKGTEMGKISHRPNLEYHVKVVDSPVVNAFAVPGGFIYLTRGIMAQLNSEAELMGILAHEMGHITARHTVSQQSKQTLGQLLLVGGMIVSEEFAQYAQYALEGMQLLFLKFSRDNEREADRLGVEYSSKLGFDAHKMADFFRVLQKMSLAESQGGIPTFLSTHPDPGDRYNSVNKDATEWQTKLKLPEYKVNHESYLQMINGMIYGEDPKQGYIDGNVFYHPELKFLFRFPTGWKLENSPVQVTLTPPDQKALVIFGISEQKTLEKAADSTLIKYNLTLQGSKKTTVNGLQALLMQSKQVSQNQSTGATQSNMILSYFISYNNIIYLFHGITAEADYNTFSNPFNATMSSFARLTDASRINVKPKRVQVVKVQKTGTLADAFGYYRIPQEKYAELALLNDIELTSQVQAGKLIKITGE